MADITNGLERTSRLSVLDGTDYISTMLGTFIGAPLFNFFGYYAVFGTSGSLAFVGALYAVFMVKESLPEKSSEHTHITTDLKTSNSPATDYGTNINDLNGEGEIEENNMIIISPSNKDKQASSNENSCANHLSTLLLGRLLSSFKSVFSSFLVIVRSRPGWNRAMVLM